MLTAQASSSLSGADAHAAPVVAPAPPRRPEAAGWEAAHVGALSPQECAGRLPGIGRGVPLAELTQLLRAAALDGSLPAGTQLPDPGLLGQLTGASPVRLAKALSVLVGEQVLDGPADSLRVRPAATPALRTNAAAMPRERQLAWARVAPGAPRHELDAVLSYEPSRTADLVFAPGEPALDLFPLHGWSRLQERQLCQLGVGALRAGHPAGYEPLRRILAARLSLLWGQAVPWSRLLLVPGRAQALRLLVQTLVDIGGQVWIEQPGDPVHRAATLGAHARAVAVPVDDSGLSAALGCELAPAARLAIASIGPQLPTSIRTSPERRRALAAWAERSDGWVIEDDCGGALLAGDDSGLQQAPAERAIVVGSFGKLLAPGIDLAWILAPEPLVDPLFAALSLQGGAPSTLLQATMVEFVQSGAFDLHVARRAEETQNRFDAFWSALHPYLGPMRAIRSDLFQATACLSLGSAEIELAMIRRAHAAGFGLLPLSGFCTGDAGSHGLVLGFGNMPVTRILAEGVRLGTILRACQSEVRPVRPRMMLASASLALVPGERRAGYGVPVRS